MSTCFVFDLDDTLIDSRQAVQSAYRRAGVEMPRDSWGKPWRDWLPDLCGGEIPASVVHAQKNQIYASEIYRYAERLPLADTVCSLYASGLKVYIITGASWEAANMAVSFLKLPISVSEAGLNSQAKSDWLWNLGTVFDHGVYFDDQDGVRVPQGWVKVHVRQMEIA